MPPTTSTSITTSVDNSKMVALFLDRLRGATRTLPRLDLLLDPLDGGIVERPGLLDEAQTSAWSPYPRRFSDFIFKTPRLLE